MKAGDIAVLVRSNFDAKEYGITFVPAVFPLWSLLILVYLKRTKPKNLPGFFGGDGCP